MEYIPLTDKVCDNISFYMNNKINENFENYNYKENRIKIIYSDLFDEIFLIKEILFEILKSKNIYLAKNNNYSQVDDYKSL